VDDAGLWVQRILILGAILIVIALAIWGLLILRR
jgi:hypothetical protein